MRHLLASTPLPVLHIPTDAERVGRLVVAARQEVGILQRQLAARLGISERSIQRMEAGQSPPGGAKCIQLAETLSDASDETWNALVEALELPLQAPPDTPAPHEPAPETDPAPGLDDLLRALADDLDVTAGRLRAAFDALLGEIDRRGLDVAKARAWLAARRGGKTGRSRSPK
jgi:transcriptional regulator with XRE-family HTH domain